MRRVLALALAAALASNPANATFAARANGRALTLHTVFLLPASSSPWTVDPTWQSTNSGALGWANKIECIGSGQAGHAGVAPQAGGVAGGYAAITNLALTPLGTAPFLVSAGGFLSAGASGGDSYFNGASIAASSVGAKGGNSASTPVGTTINAGGTSSASSVRSGGGGAGGPNGAGASVVNTIAGGAGDNGAGGPGGATDGAAGGNGTEWDATHGSGGGGAGTAGAGAAGAAGKYGAGGAAGAASFYSAGGDGLCVIRWYS